MENKKKIEKIYLIPIEEEYGSAVCEIVEKVNKMKEFEKYKGEIIWENMFIN